MSDLFGTYKNRSNDSNHKVALRAIHKAWYNGQPFASIEAMGKFLSESQLDPKDARGVWHSNNHIKWSEKRVLPSM